MSAKRSKTHVYLTLQQRFDILQKLKDGCSLSQLANDYNVTDLTIRRIKTNAAQIRQQLQISAIVHDQKKSRTPVFDELDARLHSWFLQRRAIGDLITDQQFQKKAKELNKEFGGPSSFSASRGWIWRFKRRHGIRLLKFHRDNTRSYTRAEEEFSRWLLERLKKENIELQNVYHMDDTSLMWKALPQKILARVAETSVTGIKTKKDQITVGFCANAIGTHKLPPVIVNKYGRPRALRHCHDRLPVIFMAQKNGFMDRNVFADWLKNHFRPAVRRQQLERGVNAKVLLLLHNSENRVLPTEEEKQDDNFEIVYFPMNATSILQPMGQGIIETMKKSYRHRLLRKILEFPGGLEEFFKHFDMKNCIDIVNETWTDVTQIDICKSWEKILAYEVTEEARSDREKDLSTRSTINAIPDKPIPQQEIELFSSCTETDDNLDSEVCGDRNPDKTYFERESHLDDVDVNKMFKNLVSWSKRQPVFIEIQVKSLQDFYKYTRRLCNRSPVN
ncbi:jerky protein homolog-like [Hylaeus anthracinus]|uniref:jerky protein homolog-like n=1 Tax=Hylaeus anthracinus TaxID=313031 RepID=UPI0023B89B43|nr:jerky protein homolog-like [Hylaeus anthracinus]